MNLAQARVRKPCLVVLGRFFRELSSVAGESSVFDSASFIHPTAVVHLNAVIGRVCKILSDSGSVVGNDLPGSILIGCNNSIVHHAVVGVKCQDLKYKIGEPCFLAIGNNNDIREFSSIH